MLLPDCPSQHWRLDFVSDVLTEGRRFRFLAVADDFHRENFALDRRLIFILIIHSYALY
jgi:putative transposase